MQPVCSIHDGKQINGLYQVQVLLKNSSLKFPNGNFSSISDNVSRAEEGSPSIHPITVSD